jgi:flavin-dependent dehydrogenase
MTYDVAISGAGLAGASLALRLARQGAKVALFDPASFPRDKVCGEFLSPECWGVLERLGLADEVRNSGYHAIHLVRISTPKGREVVANVTSSNGLPGIGLSRSTLDHLIVDRAKAAGVDVFESTRVSSAIVEEGRVVGVQGRGLSPIEVRSSVVIAADGRYSSLVKQTGRTRGRSWFRPRLFGLKRHFDLKNPDAAEHPGTVGLHLVSGGYGGTCRVEDGSTNLCALLPESVVKAHRGDLDRVARESLGQNPALARLLDSGEPTGDWKTVAGVQVQISKPQYPGILYAGDSQGTVDPLGGQGMTMALLGAELLGPFVERALSNGRGVDSAIQAEYQASWHRRFDRRVHLCRLFHHMLVHPGFVDLASSLGIVAERFLAACYRQTREPELQYRNRSGVVEP